MDLRALIRPQSLHQKVYCKCRFLLNHKSKLHYIPKVRPYGSRASQEMESQHDDDWDYLLSGHANSTYKQNEICEDFLRIFDQPSTVPPPTFDALHSNFPPLKPPRGASPSQGTMTKREQEIFNRIFHSILSSKDSVSMSQTTGNQLNQFPFPVLDPNPMSYVNTFPEAIQNKALRTFKTLQNDVPSTLEDKKFREARDELIARVANSLTQAQTDLDVCEIYSQNIFLPLKNGLPKRSQIKQTPFISACPVILHSIMQKMRVAFRDPAASISMFERVRALGIEAYFVGCSVDVFNEAILARWIGWKDIEAVDEVVNEMKAHCIPGNEETAQILRQVQITVDSMKASGKVGSESLWTDKDFELLSQLDEYRLGLLNKQEGLHS